MIYPRILQLRTHFFNGFNYSCYSTKCVVQSDIKRIRNIGIMAHIDAGKTTTTERMLYYSGLIKNMGEVHHGNTVTDYMEQERDRGITIKSAAVTFLWKKHQFNLIDTPGHIDFTMEVEHSLNVLDGAILVLDGSAGVEAQTLTVWRQANKYKIPRIAFVNKMDRPDADFQMSCASIAEKLEIEPLPLQMPLKSSNKVMGVIDVLTLQLLTWSTDSDKGMVCKPLNTTDAMYKEVILARNRLIDKVSEHDDELANCIIESESLEDLSTDDVVKAIARVTNEQKLMPVLCGSAYKNIGIQPLMDSVILYLPSPLQQSKKFGIFGNHFAARAFKVLHDKQRGPLVFLRIYNGLLNKAQKLFNMDKNVAEQTTRLLIAHANDFEEVDMVHNGNIAVVTGLKQTVTGDFLTQSASAAQNASDKNVESVLSSLNVHVPDPVFFCSIEPPSLAYQTALETALQELQREDPSVRVTHAADTGQTVLAGMGELHLEIVKDRILKEYKIEADLGPLQISYREVVQGNAREDHAYETKIAGSKQVVNVNLSIESVDAPVKDILKFDKSPEAASNLANIKPRNLNIIRQGLDVGLTHGPKVGAPVINVQLTLHHFSYGRGTTESAIAAATTQCVQRLLVKAGTLILEPIMHVEVITREEHLSSVMADFNRKRATVLNVGVKGRNKIVVAEVPLSELMGYSTTVRTITSGTGVFSIEFSEYREVGLNEEKIISSIRGF